ncbi:hypothetical protein AB0M54_35325 [Actinoplanes sp. NPDC051470]
MIRWQYAASVRRKFNLCGADLRNIDLTDLPRDRVVIDDETLLDPAPPE